MKLSEIKNKLMSMKPDADGVDLSFSFECSGTTVSVDWFSNNFTIAFEYYTLEEFKKLICLHKFKYHTYETTLIGTCEKCNSKSKIVIS